MRPRERFAESMAHGSVGRPLLDVGGTEATTLTKIASERLKAYLGHEELEDHVVSIPLQIVDVNDQVLEDLGSETRAVWGGPPFCFKRVPGKTEIFEDEWGTLWKPAISDSQLLYYDIVRNPLSDAKSARDLARYKWPDPHMTRFTEGVKERAQKLREKTDYVLIGNSLFAGIFETTWYLRGFSEFLVDLVAHEELANFLMDAMLKYEKAKIGDFLAVAGEYIDVLLVGDDLAHQSGLLISPETYRKMVKPYHAELFEFIKTHTNAKLFYHSCGSIQPLIEDLIEIGIDILNPIQTSAKDMDPKLLKDQYGKKICFWGGIDTQSVLNKGTPEQVKIEVAEKIETLGPSSYVVGSVHNIQPDVPPKNVVAMCEAALSWGE